MNQYLVTAIIDFIFASLALSKKNNPAAFALALVLYSAAAWSLELYALTTLSNEWLLNIVFHAFRWGMFMIPPCFALLTWYLVGARSKIFYRFTIVPCFLLSGTLGVANSFFFPSELIATDGGYLPKIDGVYYGFILTFLWSFLGAIGLSIISLKSATTRERKKVKWLSITMSVSFLFGISNIVLMSRDFYLSSFTSTLAHITFVGLLFYSTVQHHLMDLRLALSVGIARAVLLGFLIWSCFLFISIVGPIGDTPGGIVAFVALLVLVLEAYPRLLQWMLPNTKRLFAGEGFDFERTRVEFQDALNECATLKKFVSVMDHYFLQVINSKSYCVLFIEDDSIPISASSIGDADRRTVSFVPRDSKIIRECQPHAGLIIADEAPPSLQEEFESLGATLGLKITNNGQPLGMILLESSPGRDFFGYDDIRLLEWLQPELGRVVHRINQLIQMQHQLGQAKKTLSMLGVMNHYHHDIKAPLAIIDGVLSNDIYDKKKQRDIVLQQVERGSQLIATMAGILKGERRRRVRELSLEQVVRDSLFLFSQGIDEIKYEFSEIPNLKGDAEDLKILIINLAKNAMEARQDDRRLEFTVKTWMEGSRPNLSVSDTGKGMSAAQLSSLWDEDLDSSKASGNGIGLQAIKRISDEHGAVVAVESVIGEGSEFKFSFPESIVFGDSALSPAGENDFKSEKNLNKPLAS